MTATAAQDHGAYPAHQSIASSKNTVKTRLTPNRARRTVENDDYAAFARRILAAYARRIANGDIEALTQMTTLATGLDAAISQAVAGLREFGYSWAEIGLQPPSSGPPTSTPCSPA